MTKREQELLRLAGVMSDAARRVVGGRHITVGNVAPASIWNMNKFAEQLLDAVNEYDDAILDQSRGESNV